MGSDLNQETDIVIPEFNRGVVLKHPHETENRASAARQRGSHEGFGIDAVATSPSAPHCRFPAARRGGGGANYVALLRERTGASFLDRRN